MRIKALCKNNIWYSNPDMKGILKKEIHQNLIPGQYENTKSHWLYLFQR